MQPHFRFTILDKVIWVSLGRTDTGNSWEQFGASVNGDDVKMLNEEKIWQMVDLKKAEFIALSDD